MRNRQKLSREQRVELLRRLNKIPGVKLPEDSVERFPSIPLSVLAQGDNVDRFLSAIDWVNEQVSKRSAN
jgi:hypothetical protein